MLSLSLFFKYLFIYLIFWLWWVFVAAPGLSQVVGIGSCSLLWCAGFSWRLHWLRSTGSRHMGLAVTVHGLGCTKACGIFLGQGSNQRLLHCKVDPSPLNHQGSLLFIYIYIYINTHTHTHIHIHIHTYIILNF